MREIWEFIKREWEVSILVAVSLIVCGVAIYHFFLCDDQREVSLARPLQGLPVRRVCPADLAFLQPGDQGLLSRVGPWGLPECMLQEPRKAPSPVVVKAKPAVAPMISKKENRATIVPVQQPKAVASKPIKPSPKLFRGILYYSENQELADGIRVALLELTTGMERKMVVLGQGESKQGLKLDEISRRGIRLRDARGQRVELRPEREARVWYVSE